MLQLLDGIRVEQPPAWAKVASRVEPLRVVRLFLASSSELRQDRDDFELYFRKQNDRLRDDGLYLEVVRWEYFLDAMSKTRLQEEYNERVRNCDVFVSLFFTKAGKFTEEEFDAAYGQFKNSDRPLIYTYFRDADVSIRGVNVQDLISLRKFEEKLRGLGHFLTEYTSTDALNLHFRDQISMIRGKLGF